MLLTLSAQALLPLLVPAKKGRTGKGGGGDAKPQLNVVDLPRFTREELGLWGLNLSTQILAGADAKKIDAVREAADRAQCPCLVLIESEVQPMATLDEARGSQAVERMHRVVQAASRLGCNSVALKIEADEHPDAFDFAAERVRMVLQKAEKLEVNVLICPHGEQIDPKAPPAPTSAITSDPDRLTELIKRVGGFRIGTLPDFETASHAADPTLYLRRVVPYAQAVTATSVGSETKGKGKTKADSRSPGVDLALYARTVESVGYTGTLAIDYRGEGDPVEGILQARSALEVALGLGPTIADDTIDEVLDAAEDAVAETSED